MIQFLGPTGTRLRRALPAAILFAMLASLVVTLPALAVHDTGTFQLDGDASSSTLGTPPASDDWDKVCHQYAPAGTNCTTTLNTTGSTSGLWTSDGSLNATIFTGGGSKDPQDISNWAWKDGAGGLPDKDNLLHAFAVRYSLTPAATCPSGIPAAPTCDVIYFGSDRLDNSGDAQQGFWFLQDKVALGSNNVGGGSGFTGLHRNGDILVVSDFSNGGTTSTITVYEWDSTVSGNLRLVETSTSANCATVSPPPGDSFCGIVNSSTITMPWSFTDKSGTPANGALNGEFYEAGINLSAIGLGGECFSNMVAETRSSTSTTATLKDFVLGTFGKCTSGIVTTPIPSGSMPIGTGGSLSVSDQALVTVSGASTFGGTVTFHLCGPADLTVQTTCVSGGTASGSKPIHQPSPVTVNSDPATITSTGNYCWRADYSGDSVAGVPASSDSSSTECFTVTPMTPTISTSATGTVQLGTAIDDTATLSGTANQPGTPVINPSTVGAAAGGTITFSLYGPSASPICTTAIATSVVTVSGDSSLTNIYKASTGTVTGSLVPPSVGTYYWIAVYSGNSPNTNGVSTLCGDTGEVSVVTDTTTILTDQTWVPNDHAKITSAGGSALSGSVVFTLYDNGTCDGNKLYTSSSIPVSGTSPQIVNSDNTTHVSQSTTVSWLVVYTTPNGSNVAGSTSSCESTSLTIVNNPGYTPLP